VRRSITIVALATSAAACSPSSSPPADVGDASPCFGCIDADDDSPLALRVQFQLDAVCGQNEYCHGSSNGQAGLTLYPGGDFSHLIDIPSTEMPGMKRVKPYDPDRSYVWLKIHCDGGIDGGCMPLGYTYDPVRDRLFRDWIEAGAPTQ
jgi:hypothetical protein